ncbi:hypothetical protein BH20ACT20_BH20ACT20_07960 [soil metagenome]
MLSEAEVRGVRAPRSDSGVEVQPLARRLMVAAVQP